MLSLSPLKAAVLTLHGREVDPSVVYSVHQRFDEGPESYSSVFFPPVFTTAVVRATRSQGFILKTGQVPIFAICRDHFLHSLATVLLE